MKTTIKYDKRTSKIFKIVMIITGVLFLGFIMLFLMPEERVDALGGFAIFLVLIGEAAIPIFLISTVVYIPSVVYLKRLKWNTFQVPDRKADYDNDLSRVPRTEAIEGRYIGDSYIAFYISVGMYILFLVLDILYLVKWKKYEDSSIALFIMLMVGHLLYLVVGLLIRRQRNFDKYVDDVDIRNGKKVRMNIVESIGLFIVLGLIGAFSVVTAHTMTNYVYKSRYGSYDKELEDFKAKATMSISSPNLQDGRWDDVITNTDAGSNLSPEISFDNVEGAEYYVIYMVDESANYWVHWIATDIRETTLPLGAIKDKYKENADFRYVGPYPPVGSGDHEYTIYVYALKGKPDIKAEYDFDRISLRGDYLYYDRLNVSKDGDIKEYGNVIAYGYISGVYGR